LSSHAKHQQAMLQVNLLPLFHLMPAIIGFGKVLQTNKVGLAIKIMIFFSQNMKLV
jgi:hypothetical protein